MIKIAICDDEPIFCDSIKKTVSCYLAQKNIPCEIICYDDGAELLKIPHSYDLLLLDIQMPGINGIELAAKLRELEFEGAFIFITALKEYVFDAFEYEALDYICKPIDHTRLVKTLDRAVKRIQAQNHHSLLIQTTNWCKSVKLNSIYYCEVINRKIYLNTKNGIIDFYGKIEDLEKQLDQRFFKCHRSYLVNLDYVRQYSDGQISLENNEHIPVSRLRHQELMRAMLQYMKKSEE